MTSATAVTAATLRRRSAVIALGQAAVKTSQVVIAIALVRLLSSDEWSAVALVLSVYLAAVTLGSLNVQQSLLFFLPRLEAGQQRRLVVRTATVMAATGGATATIILVADPFAAADLTTLAYITPLVALAIAIEIPTAAGPAALLSIDRLVGAAGWDVVGTLALVVCVVAPAALGWGLRGVAQGMVVAAFTKACMFAAVVRRWFPAPSIVLPRGLLRRQLVYGIPLGLTIGASVLNRSVDKWLVAVFDPANLGIYAIAAQEIPLLAVLPYAGGAAVVTMLVDAFRRSDREHARALWITQTGAMSAVVVPISAALVLIAPELIALVFTAPYAAGVVPFQLFTIITIHRVAEYGMVLRAADRTRDLLVSALVLLVANLAFASVGASVWGMTGASLGTLVANVIAWLFVLGRVARSFDSSLRHSFAWRAWCRNVVVAAVALVIAATAASPVGEIPLASVAVKLTVFAAAVVVGQRWLRKDATPPLHHGDRYLTAKVEVGR
jgi:O-antigen/teichoic acid export membrane protein